jgi:cytochrome c-type biogenesis protein CcmE
MRAKHQRLVLAFLALAAILGAGLLGMSALKDQAAYFYSPADVARDGIPAGRAVRLGGMVQAGSIVRAADGVSLRFVVADGGATTRVVFRGITPDLFKENSGVIAEGRFAPDGVFVADNILAKHDERYMPPQLAGDRHKTETLK